MFVKRYLAHQSGDYKPGQFSVVGSPTLTDEGVVNGFSTSNYLLTPQVIDLSTATTWEVGMKLATGSTVSGEFDFFGCAQSEGNALGMLVYNGKWLFSIGKNGWISSTVGANTVLANTTYWVKMQFTGTNYIFSFSTDGETWIEDQNVASTTKISAGTYGYIGRSSPWLSRSFNGSIDIKECYIKINGSLWWGNQYTQDVYATKHYAITAKRPAYYKYVDWTQPVFTSNTTWGEVSATSYAANEEPWMALDGNTDGGSGYQFALNNTTTGDWFWKFPKKLKVSSIKVYRRSSYTTYGGATAYTVYGLNADGTYTQLCVRASNTDLWWLKSFDPYECYGIKISIVGSKNYAGFAEVQLTAQIRQAGTAGDYDEMAMVDKYYGIQKSKVNPATGLFLWQDATSDYMIYTAVLHPTSDADLRNADGSVYSFDGTYPKYFVSGGGVYCYSNAKFEAAEEAITLFIL